MQGNNTTQTSKLADLLSQFKLGALNQDETANLKELLGDTRANGTLSQAEYGILSGLSSDQKAQLGYYPILLDSLSASQVKPSGDVDNHDHILDKLPQ